MTTPTIDVRRAADRFATRIPWLDSHHSFSFGGHYDPANTHHGLLLVNNDDIVAPGTGFETHPHRDMEIVTYVRTGAITHQDSLGNKGRTGAGDVQVMSAGTGVTHAEYNLEGEETTLFQIWIETDKPSAKPAWGAMPFPKDSREGAFQLLASGDSADGALTINADAKVLGATIKAGQTIALDADPERHLYLVSSGRVRVNGAEAGPRDGIAVTGETRLEIAADDDAELVLVDAR